MSPSVSPSGCIPAEAHGWTASKRLDKGKRTGYKHRCLWLSLSSALLGAMLLE
jgi:hypothetical protein